MWGLNFFMKKAAPVDYSNDPKTLLDAVDLLESQLKDKDIEFLKTKSPDWFHGMNMRNNWHMWDKKSPLSIYFNSVGIVHPDDMYGTIMKALKCRVRNEPFDLNERVEFYKKYWAAMDEAEGNAVVTMTDQGEIKEISLGNGTKIITFNG